MSKAASDFTELVGQKIPEYTSQAKDGNFASALENLLLLEKKTRTGEDVNSTEKVLLAIADISLEQKEFKSLNENIVQLSKRRGLLKNAFKSMVKHCITALDSLPYDPKMELIDTLLNVTDGKIFVEKQRARLVLLLSHIKEEEDKIDEAAKIIQEIQVETFGAMKMKEKTDYILEQMRLTLKNKDMIRTQIISRKINEKVLNADDFQDQKIRFNQQMVQYHLDKFEYIEIAKNYHKIYTTPKIQENDAEKLETLKQVCLYIILSENSNEQIDFINRVAADPNTLKIETYKKLVDLFILQEVMKLEDIKTTYLPEISKLDGFTDKLWEDLQVRIIEHNLLVVSSYYTTITTQRLSQLLNTSEADSEKHLSRLVVKGAIWAKINRPAQTIKFRPLTTPNQVLNDWSSDISKLLGLVENTVHLINRENMVHSIRQ